MDTEAAKKRCIKHRKRILELSQNVTALHVAPSFSCVEIVDAIYYELMNEDDIFIMSKGHGVPTQYVILEDLGILSKFELDNYCKPSGYLGAHPDYGVPGIEASTGSLGHGLGIAVGRAYAEVQKKSGKKVYCLLSDGEIAEGSIWEALMCAANLQLSNLVVFVDNNDYGGLEKISEEQPWFYPLGDKFGAFGWDWVEVEGHNTVQIVEYVKGIVSSHPLALICKTIKGYPVSYMIDSPIWHYRSPNPEEYQQALRDIGVSQDA